MKIIRELVGMSGNSSLRLLEIEMDFFDHPYHFHDELELTFIVKGGGSLLVGDSIHPFDSGEVVLFGSRLAHQYRSVKKDSEALVVQFPLDILVSQDGAPLPEMRSLFAWLKTAARGILFGVLPMEIESSIRRIFQVSTAPERLLALLEVLLKLQFYQPQTYLASVVYSLEVKVNKLRQMDKILAYVEQHYCDELTLAEVAQVAKCHPHSLSRLFSQSLGCSFQSYLGEIRLLKAAQLLLGSDKSITEIAFDVGFRNLSNFNRQFKKKHGFSPSVYRKGGK